MGGAVSRQTLTRSWRGATERLPDIRFVDVTEDAPAPARAAHQVEVAPVVEYTGKEIGKRLENWSRWCRSGRAGGGADCMTGAICEGLRKAALGNVWSGNEVRIPIDDVDAVRIELAMRQVTVQHRMLLDWCYIEQAQVDLICRKMSIPSRPPDVFTDLLAQAQEAIRLLADKK
jgi:hypothetical protein